MNQQCIHNTAQVRFSNLDQIRNVLKAIPSGTKNTVSRLTGLSVATCNTLLNELANSGEIIEVCNPDNGICVGRPSKVYRINENFSYVLCMYVTVINQKQKIHYGVLNLLGQIVEQAVLDYDLIQYDEIERVIADCLERFPQITSIGFGIPGIVNRDMSVEACDIEALNYCDLGRQLKKKFAVDVVVDNDMNLIAYGFYHDKDSEDDTSLALVSFFDEVCAGCGIIVNGSIFHGSSNFAGEISYLPFEINRDLQIDLTKEATGLLNLVSKSVVSLIAIINPKLIILTGNPLKMLQLSALEQICLKYIPKEHMPDIRYYEEIDHYYLQGLFSLASGN